MTEFLWRFELDGKGAVLSCVRVEQAFVDEVGGFIYVRAATREQAGRKAFNEYTKQKQRDLRARRIAAGLCAWCGRKNDRGAKKRCTRCLRADDTYRARAAAKVRGEPFEPADRSAALALRNAEKRAEIVAGATPLAMRIEILSEVQKAWQHAPNNGRFTAWLDLQIELAKGKRVA